MTDAPYWQHTGRALEAAHDESTAREDLEAIVALHRGDPTILLAVAQNPVTHRSLLVELATIGIPHVTGAVKRHPNR
jgi:hypothetical protein